LFSQFLEKPRYTLAKNLEMNACFGDFYLCNSLKAEFLFVAVTAVEAFALSKEFLIEKLFPRYPSIFNEIKDSSKYEYNSLIKYELLKHKNEHISYVSKSHTYQEFAVTSKRMLSSQEVSLNLPPQCTRDEYEGYMTRMRFRDRLFKIEMDVDKIRRSMKTQMELMTHDFEKVVFQSRAMGHSREQLIEMNKETKIELNQLKS
jgi:hypothetical protein